MTTKMYTYNTFWKRDSDEIFVCVSDEVEIYTIRHSVLSAIFS